MNKKLQVFVSSTYTDLIEERQAAVEAILDAGHIPAGMELFKAGKSQMKTIKKWIDESDVYMLILGGRYGSIEEESGLSYTEIEYRYALSKNIPVFAIVLDEIFLTAKINSLGLIKAMEQTSPDKYQDFKNYVKTNIVKFADNIDKIPTIIHSHIYDILNSSEYNLIGWVRNTNEYHQSIDYQHLFKIFECIDLYEENEKHWNANEYFIVQIDKFIIGVSDSYCKTIYHRYSKIYLYNNLLQKENDENGNEMLQLTKLGYEYYNYLLTNNVDK